MSKGDAIRVLPLCLLDHVSAGPALLWAELEHWMPSGSDVGGVDFREQVAHLPCTRSTAYAWRGKLEAAGLLVWDGRRGLGGRADYILSTRPGGEPYVKKAPPKKGARPWLCVPASILARDLSPESIVLWTWLREQTLRRFTWAAARKALRLSKAKLKTAREALEAVGLLAGHESLNLSENRPHAFDLSEDRPNLSENRPHLSENRPPPVRESTPPSVKQYVKQSVKHCEAAPPYPPSQTDGPAWPSYVRGAAVDFLKDRGYGKGQLRQVASRLARMTDDAGEEAFREFCFSLGGREDKNRVHSLVAYFEPIARRHEGNGAEHDREHGDGTAGAAGAECLRAYPDLAALSWTYDLPAVGCAERFAVADGTVMARRYNGATR